MTTGRWPDLLSDLARRRSTAGNARLDELCEYAPDGARQEDLVFWFTQLVAWLRPKSHEGSRARVRFLRARLENHPAWKRKVSTALSKLMGGSKLESFLAYGGIPRDFHFLGALGQWFSARLLPSPCRTTDIERIVQLAFREADLDWLAPSGAAALLAEFVDANLHAGIAAGLREATLDLAQQLAAQAHAPSVRSLAPQDRSSFRGLYEAVTKLHDAEPDGPTLGAVRDRIKQCLLAVESLRAQLAERGADLNTTFQLSRMRLQLERLMLLVSLRSADASALPRARTELARVSSES